MGNPAWGHGYGQGHDAGLKQGRLIGGVIGAGVVGLAAGVKWLYDRAKDDRADSADAPGEVSPNMLGDDHP